MKFKPGDTVRVVGERGTSIIRSIMTAVNGALLDTPIRGFRQWSLEDLRLVKPADASRKRMSDDHRAKLMASAKQRWGKPKQRSR
jgi:hypothetical protein